MGRLCVCVCVGGRGGGGHYVSHPSFLPCCRRNCFQTVFTDFGQPIDLKLVTLITGICKSGNLFMLILCGYFGLEFRIIGVSVITRCPQGQR